MDCCSKIQIHRLRTHSKCWNSKIRSHKFQIHCRRRRIRIDCNSGNRGNLGGLVHHIARAPESVPARSSKSPRQLVSSQMCDGQILARLSLSGEWNVITPQKPIKPQTPMQPTRWSGRILLSCDHDFDMARSCYRIPSYAEIAAFGALQARRFCASPGLRDE
jgi:hypothetical protein